MGLGMLTSFATVMATAGIALACLAAYVAWRRDARMGWSLAVLLLAGAWWGLAYAVELSVDDVALKSRWGDLKYLGIVTLAPAWLVFVLQYVGRQRWVTWRLLCALAVVPVVTTLLLAIPATHDLVRSYPPAVGGEEPEVQAGPLFNAFFGYNYAVLVGATVLFVASMGRLARSYRRMAVVLVIAALVPLTVNALYNTNVGWFASIDLTPFAFTLTGAVLVWGLFHERLVDLGPLARSAVLERMADGVYVTDPYGRIVDLNPAAIELLGTSRTALLGRRLRDVVPADASDEGTVELDLRGLDGALYHRTFDISREQLSDVAGRPAGVVVVLHEITERVHDRQRLERILEDQSRVAAALQASMVPPTLPDVTRHRAREPVPACRGRSGGGWRLPGRIRPGQGHVGLRAGRREREGRGGGDGECGHEVHTSCPGGRRRLAQRDGAEGEHQPAGPHRPRAPLHACVRAGAPGARGSHRGVHLGRAPSSDRAAGHG